MDRPDPNNSPSTPSSVKSAKAEGPRQVDPQPEALDGHQHPHPRVGPQAPHPGLRHGSRKTLVLGASTKPDRYAYKAAFRLLEEGHETVLLGNRADKLFGLDVHAGMPEPDSPEGEAFRQIDTVTLYLNPRRQEAYEDWLLALKPARVIFNPGTENPPFAARLRESGVEVLPACTLVMLSAGMY